MGLPLAWNLPAQPFWGLASLTRLPRPAPREMLNNHVPISQSLVPPLAARTLHAQWALGGSTYDLVSMQQVAWP